MEFNKALRRYREGVFTDRDVTRCTGLSERAWRELIKLGAVRTITEKRGPGRVRLCDAKTLKRASIIAALNRTGLSLVMSGWIAYFLPLDELLYVVVDPSTILLQGGAKVDLDTGLPPLLKEPKADWFEPDKPAQADPDEDWLIEIYEGRFVASLYGAKDKPSFYGDLRDGGTRFISWFPAHRQFRFMDHESEDSVRAVTPNKLKGLVAKWENPTKWADRLDPRFLNYKFENHDAEDDALCRAAEVAARSPTFKTTINVTLAIRKALRRYLGIEPAGRIG
jgi:hypothetical protein